METFYKRNDIGVNIEYSIIGYYEVNNSKYRLYTDFVTDKSNPVGIRVFVDLVVDDKFVRLPIEEEKRIITKYNKEILHYAKQRELEARC